MGKAVSTLYHFLEKCKSLLQYGLTFLKKLRSVRTLLLGLFLIGASLYVISLVLLPKQAAYLGLLGFNVSYCYDKASSIEMQLQPIFDEDAVVVSILIQQWDDMKDCDCIDIASPWETWGHSYMVPLYSDPPSSLPVPWIEGTCIKDWLFESNNKELENEPDVQLYLQARRTFDSNMFLGRVTKPAERVDYMRIYTSQIEDFSGGIEFICSDALKRISFTKYALLFPFGKTPVLEELPRTEVYNVAIWVPRQYSIVSATPQPSRIKLWERFNYYEFDINIHESDLVIEFEDRRLAEIQDYIVLISGTMLGVGLAIVVQRVTERVRIRTRKHKDNGGKL